MKRIFALLLALIMIFSLAACGKSGAGSENGGDETTAAAGAAGGGAGGGAGGKDYAAGFDDFVYTGADGGNYEASDLDTGTGMSGVNVSITDNNDLINPEKFGGKKLQIYGYSGSYYEDFDNMVESPTFIWMVRAAVAEWAYLNNVEVEFMGGYDQSVILGDIHSGGKPDLLLYCNKFPLPALTGITRAFTAEEYAELSKTCGSYYLDMLNYKGESYGVVAPWSGGQMVYYNKTAFEDAGIKSPGEYFMDDEWTWDAYEECITDITQDTNGDGTIDIYGSGSTMFMIPQPMYRRLNDDGTLTSLVRNSEAFLRYLQIYYRACTETKSTGKYAAAYTTSSPRPAISIGDAEWYTFAHMNQEK